jgi:hypothetical protein
LAAIIVHQAGLDPFAWIKIADVGLIVGKAP